jgi:glutathione S-transferase
MRLIYHLASRPAWERAPAEPYRADSLTGEGFIHCSNADQVAWAANRFCAGADDLLVLFIDAGRLTSPLRDEDGGNGPWFPHVYGPINRDAVVAVQPLRRGPDGLWAFTPEGEGAPS